MKRSLKNKGFTLLEVVVAIGLAAAVMGGITIVMGKAMSLKSASETLNRIKKIEAALEITYRENVNYVEQNCYGWTSSPCDNIVILPTQPSSTTIYVYTYSDTVRNAWREAGCSLSVSGSITYGTCPDGYGSNFTFTGLAYHHAGGTNYLNGYNRTPYSVTITSGTNAAITDTWNSGHLDSEYLARSQEKILTVARAMKSYHLSRLVTEAIKRPCTAGVGGLESSDDIVIPWIWQAPSSNPSSMCSGISAGSCGCTAFSSSYWPNNIAYNTINTAALWTSLLNGIGLNTSYRVDGYGNAMTAGLLTQPNGNIIASIPATPAPSYSWAGASPPYGGHVGLWVGGSWVYSERVIYAQ